MSQTFRRALIALGFIAAAWPAVAHHAVQAQFDFDKPIEVKGKLSKVEWVNPHSYFYFDVADSKGAVKQWAFETTGPGGLRKAGLSRQSRGGFKVGDMYTIHGFASRDGSTSGFATAIGFPDGRVVTIWFGDPNAN